MLLVPKKSRLDVRTRLKEPSAKFTCRLEKIYLDYRCVIMYGKEKGPEFHQVPSTFLTRAVQ